MSTSLIAWDLFDLCVIGAELESLEATTREAEVSDNLCGYDVSVSELLQMSNIEVSGNIEGLMDSEAWTELSEYAELAAEGWNEFDAIVDRFSDILK